MVAEVPAAVLPLPLQRDKAPLRRPARPQRKRAVKVEEALPVVQPAEEAQPQSISRVIGFLSSQRTGLKGCPLTLLLQACRAAVVEAAVEAAEIEVAHPLRRPFLLLLAGSNAVLTLPAAACAFQAGCISRGRTTTL